MVIARISNLLGIALVVIIGCGVSASGKYGGGSGEPNSPYLIYDANHMQTIGADSNDWDKHFKMIADINMADYSYITALIAPDTSSNNGFQGTKFTGVFDGNSHTIFSLEINDSGAGNDYIGLFGYIGIGGQVLNLAVEDVNIKGGDYVGGLIGWIESGTVSNCYSTGSISGFNYVGRLVGNNHGTLTNCYSNGLVSGTGDHIGGLIGWNEFGKVYGCYSSGLVSGTGNFIGGLIGNNYSGKVDKCFSTGMVTGTAAVGGLIGQNYFYLGSVNKCYSTSSVSGYYKVGGLVGTNENSNISNCYSTGSVSETGEKIGGLIGANYGSVNNCFWDIQTSGQSIGVGYGSSGGVTGKLTAEMQMISTFNDGDWDFINVWNIGENQTYPYLRVHLAADINKDGIVNFLDVAITANQWMEEQ